MKLEFTELESDALSEVFNLGIGRAAQALNRMVSDTIGLTIPKVLIIPQKEAAALLSTEIDGVVNAVTQRFSGDFSGNAVLMFPREQSLNLVRTLLQDDVPLETLTELEQEALIEVGNVILNACFGTVTNVLKFDCEISTPLFVQGTASEIHTSGSDSADWTMYIQVEFSLEHNNIHGFVTFMMDIDSATRFRDGIREFIGDIAPDKRLQA
ncbi:MAG: chemotaxis protein CheC [Moraxellaceae bacterium]|nr:MAG: chemotaxis protein CheC [Moraxellaceae bacterium]